MRKYPATSTDKFLSTPSARRATFSILSQLASGNQISIHALREEGDPLKYRSSSAGNRFLSTPSARRATGQAGCPSSSCAISIHALREEGDWLVTPLLDCV